MLAWPWEARYGLADARHSHIVCLGCGSVAEVTPDVLGAAAAAVQRQSGFTPLGAGQTLLGHCAGCREAAGPGSESGSWYPGTVLTPLARP